MEQKTRYYFSFAISSYCERVFCKLDPDPNNKKQEFWFKKCVPVERSTGTRQGACWDFFPDFVDFPMYTPFLLCYQRLKTEFFLLHDKKLWSSKYREHNFARKPQVTEYFFSTIHRYLISHIHIMIQQYPIVCRDLTTRTTTDRVAGCHMCGIHSSSIEESVY